MSKNIVIKHYKSLLIFLFSVVVIGKTYSQDFHLSQFDAFAQFLNPSLTGMFNGDYRANFHYRTQWNKVLTNPYETVGFGFDMPHNTFFSNTNIKKLRLGAFVLNERAGQSNFNVFTLKISTAYDFILGNTNNHIATGAQLGVINKSVNLEKLYYDNQYSNQNGGGFNTSQSTGEIFNNTNIFLPDFNLGFMYYYAKTSSRINPFAGASVLHITQPKDEFFESDDVNKLPRRYNFNVGTKINITKYVQLNLHALYMQQTSNVRELQTCLMANTFLPKRDEVCFLYGVSFRQGFYDDAQIIHLGMKYREFTARLSYDVNISSLTTYSNGRGGFELSLIYVRNKPVKIPPVYCPRI